MSSPPTIPILFAGLIAWSIYRRVRRNVGRQKLRPRRITVSIVILSIVTILLFSASLPHPHRCSASAADCCSAHRWAWLDCA